MIFSELYSEYYNTIAAVLREALERPLTRDELFGVIEKHAFVESAMTIEPALSKERWQLLRPDGTTPLLHEPSMPLTTLEKRWLKAIFADPRIRLFTDEIPDFPDVEPLFGPEDVVVFDKYADGDPYEDKRYIQRFRMISAAIRDRYPLKIDILNRKGAVKGFTVMPEYLEYSEKDDKFRLIGRGRKFGVTLNLGRILRCELCTDPFDPVPEAELADGKCTVAFDLFDDRNALERALLHFAHFEKQVERIDGYRYKVTLAYDREDETEMVIRILSFGPMVRVTEPESFVELIKDRLKRQKGLPF